MRRAPSQGVRQPPAVSIGLTVALLLVMVWALEVSNPQNAERVIRSNQLQQKLSREHWTWSIRSPAPGDDAHPAGPHFGVSNSPQHLLLDQPAGLAAPSPNAGESNVTGSMAAASPAAPALLLVTNTAMVFEPLAMQTANSIRGQVSSRDVCKLYSAWMWAL